MPSSVRHITFDVAPPHEPYAVAEFWGHVVDRPVHPDDAPGDDECLVDVPGQPGLLFIRVPEAKTVKNRVHLDLQPGGTRDAEVERVVALGATIVDDRRTPNGRGWVVLADPAGNEFCLEMSEADLAATGGAEPAS